MTGGERTLSSEDAADRIPRLVLTALAALFLVAGSTYLWRSKKSRHGPAPDILKPVSSLFDTYSIRQESGSSPGEISQLGGSPETVGHIEDATAAPVDDGMSKKSTRSKDRRRRGKDPLKDAFKKGKSSLRLPKPAADDDQGTNSNSAIASRSSSSAPMSAPHVESVEVSDCPASPPARKNKGKIMSTHGPCQESKVEGFTNADSIQEPNARISMHQATSVAVPTVEPRIEAAQKYDDSTTFSNATTSSSDLHDLEADYFGTGVQEAFGVCLSPSSASNCDSTSETHSHSTKDTSPPPSLVHDAPNDYLPPSQSMPSNLSVYVSNDVPSLHSPRPRKSSKSSVQNLQGPWDWDGQSHPHSPSAHTSYIKPPRFRSQAKHSQASGGFMARLSSSVSCTLPYLDPYSPSPSHSPPPLESPDVHTSSDARDTSMDAPTFTFPTLNAPSASPSPSSASSHQSGHGYKPTTPSRSSSSQSQSPLPNNTPVSTNTQLASLRGALEAARQREEKSKQRADKLSRDSETLKRRWGEEVVAWRRRESEVRAGFASLAHLVCPR
jgi:anthranilate synthase/indole-3-glycerol phosphate synthase/phosphoribosylanthranilate isomerase